MVATISATQTALSAAGMGRSIRQIQTMVVAVFTLPDQPAAMTRPLSTATSRSPVTANSLATTIRTVQAGICPASTNHSMAETTSSLSANGSMNFPKSVIWL